MSQILINPEEVSDAGSTFKSKEGELETLLSTVSTLMNNLASTFTGQRATAIQNEWQNYIPKIKEACNTLNQTGEFLTKAAAAFSDADSGL